MDPMVISMIASAVLGYQKNKEQQQNYADNQKVEATKEKFSGFNGVQGQNLGRPSQVDPIFQSLIAGAMMGQNLKKAGYGKDGDGPTTADQPATQIGAIGSTKPTATSPYKADGAYDQGYDRTQSAPLTAQNMPR